MGSHLGDASWVQIGVRGFGSGAWPNCPTTSQSEPRTPIMGPSLLHRPAALALVKLLLLPPLLMAQLSGEARREAEDAGVMQGVQGVQGVYLGDAGNREPQEPISAAPARPPSGCPKPQPRSPGIPKGIQPNLASKALGGFPGPQPTRVGPYAARVASSAPPDSDTPVLAHCAVHPETLGCPAGWTVHLLLGPSPAPPRSRPAP